MHPRTRSGIAAAAAIALRVLARRRHRRVARVQRAASRAAARACRRPAAGTTDGAIRRHDGACAMASARRVARAPARTAMDPRSARRRVERAGRRARVRSARTCHRESARRARILRNGVDALAACRARWRRGDRKRRRRARRRARDEPLPRRAAAAHRRYAPASRRVADRAIAPRRLCDQRFARGTDRRRRAARRPRSTCSRPSRCRPTARGGRCAT